MIRLGCPHCGMMSVQCEVIRGLDGDYYVRCNRCRARGPRSFDFYDAERLWDRRLGHQEAEDFKDLFRRI